MKYLYKVSPQKIGKAIFCTYCVALDMMDFLFFFFLSLILN